MYCNHAIFVHFVRVWMDVLMDAYIVKLTAIGHIFNPLYRAKNIGTVRLGKLFRIFSRMRLTMLLLKVLSAITPLPLFFGCKNFLKYKQASGSMTQTVSKRSFIHLKHLSRNSSWRGPLHHTLRFHNAVIPSKNEIPLVKEMNKNVKTHRHLVRKMNGLKKY